jgi:hypothetical protein
MQFKGANNTPIPVANRPERNTENGINKMKGVNGRSKIYIIGKITKQLINVVTILPTTEVIGNTIRGKYTKWIVFLFLVNELTVDCKDLPKQPQIIIPIRT